MKEAFRQPIAAFIPGKSVFKALSVILLALTCAVVFNSPANAELKITVKNNRSHNLSLAFRWSRFDDSRVSGWYSVAPGQTRTITIDAVYALTSLHFGYYAQGGGTVWQGKGEVWKERIESWINPKDKFFGDADVVPRGMQKVSYKIIKLKQTSQNRENGAATLTFNP